MQRRTVDAPGRGDLCSTAEAARFVGVSADYFLELVDREDWMHPYPVGTKHRWFWLDVVTLSHLYRSRQRTPVVPEKKT